MFSGSLKTSSYGYHLVSPEMKEIIVKGLGSVMVLCVVGRCLAGKLFKCGGKRVSVIEPTFERELF